VRPKGAGALQGRPSLKAMMQFPLFQISTLFPKMLTIRGNIPEFSYFFLFQQNVFPSIRQNF